MSKFSKSVLLMAMCVAAATLSSCSKDSEDDKGVPSQQEIESKIIGRWKSVKLDGIEICTNNKLVATYQQNGKGTNSISRYNPENNIWYWENKSEIQYSITDNHLYETLENGSVLLNTITAISENQYTRIMNGYMADGVEYPSDATLEYTKVTADYSDEIIGLWEGVEMTGYETYGDAEARIEYKADGTYTYYVKEGDNWVASANVDNEYNVDGDWLATRWRPEVGADFNYEWWDIDEIKDGTMKWSALREKEDGTRFNTTFTWRKIQQ